MEGRASFDTLRTGSATPQATGLAETRASTIERTVERVLKERTSVKDVIEACGVPHPEVDLIRWNAG
jgi:Mut7-C ubiquitin